MFEDLLSRLKSLDGVEINIRAEGEYPTTRRTKVQDVAHYQNDGTETIKPAQFVETAERQNRGWKRDVFDAVSAYINGPGVWYELVQAGMKISYDINVAVNRIKTGRLKKSFRPQLRRPGAAGWRPLD